MIAATSPVNAAGASPNGYYLTAPIHLKIKMRTESSEQVIFNCFENLATGNVNAAP
jgi:hypothetical protein